MDASSAWPRSSGASHAGFRQLGVCKAREPACSVIKRRNGRASADGLNNDAELFLARACWKSASPEAYGPGGQKGNR